MSSMAIVAPPRGPGEWGNGGWLAPEEREALDWATLARLSGWEVSVDATPDGRGDTWLVIACDPDDLDERSVEVIADRLEREPVCVVTRAPSSGAPLAKLSGAVRTGAGTHRGQALCWTGPGAPERWWSGDPIDAARLSLRDGARTWATVKREPVIAVRRFGRGLVAALAFHPSAARDCDGAGTAVLRRLLVAGAGSPVAWLDFEGAVVLRMDDPGSSEAAYHRGWAHSRLGPAGWAEIGEQLARRRGRISLGYVIGWVDDGDEAHGRLEIDGQTVPRVPGKIHPSPAVRYTDVAGVSPGRVHDLATQFAAICSLRRSGLAEVELHGFTHVHPERERWAHDPERSEALGWYRELHEMKPGLDLLRPAVERFEHHWGTRPTTLIPPGDAFNAETMRRALELELDLVCSYYLALRIDREWWWSQHVCSPYLTRAHKSWFTSGLPVVGYFHEHDVAVEDAGWFAERLIEWESAGARRFIDFRQLVDALACRPTVELHEGEPGIDLGRRSAWPVAVKSSARGRGTPIAEARRPTASEAMQ